MSTESKPKVAEPERLHILRFEKTQKFFVKYAKKRKIEGWFNLLKFFGHMFFLNIFMTRQG